MRVNHRKYLDAYKALIGIEIPRLLKDIDFTESNGASNYFTKSSAVYSSNIEDNSIDLNSYLS